MADNALPPIVTAIIAALLDQAEQPNRQRTPRVSLNEKDHAAYFSTESGEPRQQVHDALRVLEQQGAVHLQWRRWEEGNWLASVSLVPQEAGTLYALVGRAPRITQETLFAALLDSQTPLDDWHVRLLDAMRDRLAGNRSLAPFNLLDPSGNVDLLRLAAAVAALDAPVLERTLSVRVFGDSKRAESLRRGMLTILREFSATASDRDLDDWSVLRAHLRRPHARVCPARRPARA